MDPRVSVALLTFLVLKEYTCLEPIAPQRSSNLVQFVFTEKLKREFRRSEGLTKTTN